MKFGPQQLLLALAALLHIQACLSLRASNRKPLKVETIHRQSPPNLPPVRPIINQGRGITNPETYVRQSAVRKPNMGSLNGYIFRINYDVPDKVTKIFHRLYENPNLQYKDIPAELLKYELKGDDIPEALRKKSKSGKSTSIVEKIIYKEEEGRDEVDEDGNFKEDI